MPVITIEMSNKWKIETAILVKNIVLDTVIKIFDLKSTERNIKVIRHEQDLFELTSPYEIFVKIDLISGRGIDFKRELYNELTKAIDEKTMFKKDNIFIFLNEQPAENWGIKGGVPASDLEEKI